ncbi:hypothetical protein Fluta_3042 [Fluviicola taffensis DSM 16823]|uniref:Uncharacterized protein n=1 Tax=Fluviicola taffensis (strain DSM 16823 / NCIMB 13979 / RW262) TaxID=755732 RepID=F2IJW0_FLUTR|nr:hypothetical protein Fluta_3042 [Fluviicola taffensis DSM 16823]
MFKVWIVYENYTERKQRRIVITLEAKGFTLKAYHEVNGLRHTKAYKGLQNLQKNAHNAREKNKILPH